MDPPGASAAKEGRFSGRLHPAGPRSDSRPSEAAEGISAAVIDPRTLVPFDNEAVASSLRRTHRLAVVQEAPHGGSWGASLVARMMQDHFTLFDAPPLVIGTDETPAPYSAVLEDAWLPSVARIVAEVRKLVGW